MKSGIRYTEMKHLIFENRKKTFSAKNIALCKEMKMSKATEAEEEERERKKTEEDRRSHRTVFGRRNTALLE